MKLILEMNPNGGLKIDVEGKVPHTAAMGMIEHARAILRADAIQAHLNAQQSAPASYPAPVALRVCKHCLRAIRKTEDGDGWHDIGELSPKYCDKSPDTADHEPLETYEVKL